MNDILRARHGNLLLLWTWKHEPRNQKYLIHSACEISQGRNQLFCWRLTPADLVTCPHRYVTIDIAVTLPNKDVDRKSERSAKLRILSCILTAFLDYRSIPQHISRVSNPWLGSPLLFISECPKKKKNYSCRPHGKTQTLKSAPMLTSIELVFSIFQNFACTQSNLLSVWHNFLDKHTM